MSEYCEQPDYTNFHTELAPDTDALPDYDSALDSRTLIVSNAPETLGPVPFPPPTNSWSWTGLANLYKREFAVGGTRDFRFYLWHVNDFTDRAMTIQIVLEGMEGSISNANGVEWNALEPDLSVPGICMSKSLLYETWDENLEFPTSISTDGTVLWEATRPEKQGTGSNLVALICDFTVTGLGTLKIRVTAFDDAGDYDPSWSTTVCSYYDNAGGSHHIRGSWGQSSIKMRIANGINVDPTLIDPRPNFESCEVYRSSGPETSSPSGRFGYDSGDSYATPGGNKGGYGAITQYVIAVTNTEKTPQPLGLYLRGRNSGCKFWGASNILAPGSATPEKGVFKLEETNDEEDANMLNYYEHTSEQYKVIAANLNDPVDYVMQITAGGGAALPVNFIAARGGLVAELIEEENSGS